MLEAPDLPNDFVAHFHFHSSLVHGLGVLAVSLETLQLPSSTSGAADAVVDLLDQHHRGSSLLGDPVQHAAVDVAVRQVEAQRAVAGIEQVAQVRPDAQFVRVTPSQLRAPHHPDVRENVLQNAQYYELPKKLYLPRSTWHIGWVLVVLCTERGEPDPSQGFVQN